MKSRLIALATGLLLNSCEGYITRPNDVGLTLRQQKLYNYTVNVIPLGRGVIGFYGTFDNLLEARLRLTPNVKYMGGGKEFNADGYFFLEFDPISGPKTNILEVPERGNVYWAAKAQLEKGLEGYEINFDREDATKSIPSLDEFFNQDK